MNPPAGNSGVYRVSDKGLEKVSSADPDLQEAIGALARLEQENNSQSSSDELVRHATPQQELEAQDPITRQFDTLTKNVLGKVKAPRLENRTGSVLQQELGKGTALHRIVEVDDPHKLSKQMGERLLPAVEEYNHGLFTDPRRKEEDPKPGIRRTTYRVASDER